MSEISFIVKDRQADSSGKGFIKIGLPASTKPPKTTNELLTILNTLKNSQYLNPTVQVGFDYTLDFILEAGHGFPYVLDFTLE